MGSIKNRLVATALVGVDLVCTVGADDFSIDPTDWQISLAFDVTPTAGSYAVHVKAQGSDSYEVLYANGVPVVIQAATHGTVNIYGFDLLAVKLVPTGIATAASCTMTLSGG